MLRLFDIIYGRRALKEKTSRFISMSIPRFRWMVLVDTTPVTDPSYDAFELEHARFVAHQTDSNDADEWDHRTKTLLMLFDSIYKMGLQRTITVDERMIMKHVVEFANETWSKAVGHTIVAPYAAMFTWLHMAYKTTDTKYEDDVVYMYLQLMELLRREKGPERFDQEFLEKNPFFDRDMIRPGSGSFYRAEFAIALFFAALSAARSNNHEVIKSCIRCRNYDSKGLSSQQFVRLKRAIICMVILALASAVSSGLLTVSGASAVVPLLVSELPRGTDPIELFQLEAAHAFDKISIYAPEKWPKLDSSRNVLPEVEDSISEIIEHAKAGKFKQSVQVMCKLQCRLYNPATKPNSMRAYMGST
jgi:hypothetical protein